MPRIRKKNEPMTPEAIAPEELQVIGEAPLELRWVLVDDLVLLEGNPKDHNIGLIADSITENGFRDPPSWDANLNNGAGGIVEGNGRSQALKMMQDQGMGVPRGLATVKDGRWACPVLFGMDARSEAAAKRYAIDHNGVTILGGSLTALDASRAFNGEEYIQFLQELEAENEMPLTVSSDDLQLIKDAMAGKFLDREEENDEEKEGKGHGEKQPHQCPNCGHVF